MTELVTHNEDRPGPKRNGKAARAVGAVLVSGNQLSRHLGISRQAVDQLAAQRVIVRRSDGYFDQDAARLAYIGHLRNGATRLGAISRRTPSWRAGGKRA